jgi:hypothetical protein
MMEPTQNELNELNSKRYGPEAFWVLPLASGRIAVLTPNRAFYRIVANFAEAIKVGPMAESYQLAKSRSRASEERQLELAMRAENLEETLNNLELDL